MLRNNNIHSYYDRIDLDYNNKTFFIYSLSKYNNRHLYYYGETLDLNSTEFKLAKTLPTYKKILEIPSNDIPNLLNNFENKILKYKSKLPIKNSDLNNNIFSIDDDYELNNIISYLISKYKSISDI